MNILYQAQWGRAELDGRGRVDPILVPKVPILRPMIAFAMIFAIVGLLDHAADRRPQTLPEPELSNAPRSLK